MELLAGTVWITIGNVAMGLLMLLDACQLELFCSSNRRPILLGFIGGILPVILAEYVLPLLVTLQIIHLHIMIVNPPFLILSISERLRTEVVY